MNQSKPETAARTAWLVSHGQEHVALGGPTTRLSQIVRTAREEGHAISSTSNVLDLLRHEAVVSVTHVFNSWSLQSGLTTLAAARRTQQPVVFSPIMLNLADRAFYDEGVKSMLARAKSANDVEVGAALIHKMTPRWDRNVSLSPRQGVASHYDFIRRQTSLADKIVCLSAYERDLLESIGVPTDNVSIIPNGVDTAVMRDADSTLFQQAYGLNDFVLMVGRIEPRKNQALSAFALRDLGRPVVCIGHIGDQAYFDQLKKWAGPRFVHIDRISDRQMLASAYKAASVLLLASWSEGAPLVALEAAAAGTSLVLSTMSSEQDYFGEFASYVHPADLESIRAAVRPLVFSPQSTTLRLARSQYAQDKFSIAKHVDQTLALYERALSEGSQKSLSNPRPAMHLDVTHLAHQIHNRKPLTGVPVVEKELGHALLSLKPKLSMSVWSSKSRMIENIPTRVFGLEAMGDVANKPETTSDAFDIFCERVEVSEIAPRFSFLGFLPNRGPGLRRRVLTLLKHCINALPVALKNRVLQRVRKHRPNFSNEVAPQHYLLERARLRHSTGQMTGTGAGRFQVRVLERQEALRARGQIANGARLIVLGHAWISNDRYLDDLIETVARDDLKLWIHVPDILYATRRGTFDVDTAATYTRRLETILALADTVITISAQSRAQITAFAQARGFRPNICQVTLGVPSQAHTDNVPARLVNGSGPFVLYVASMSERKRHEFLIEAWRRARDESDQVAAARLVLVGQPLPGFERFRDHAFHKKLAQSGITVINECDADQLAQLYRQSAFTVYPSAAEGWGLPPVESLSMGKPCLVSASLPVAEEIKSGGLKSVPTHSIDAWANALDAWLASPQDLALASEAAILFAPPSWRAAAEKILAG